MFRRLAGDEDVGLHLLQFQTTEDVIRRRLPGGLREETLEVLVMSRRHAVANRCRHEAVRTPAFHDPDAVVRQSIAGHERLRLAKPSRGHLQIHSAVGRNHTRPATESSAPRSRSQRYRRARDR